MNYFEEIKDVDPCSFDDESSKYNILIHAPNPTVSYVRTITGIDLAKECGNEPIALGVINSYTTLTMSIVKSLVSRSSVSIRQSSEDMIEYLIAKDRNYREGFILAVAKAILTTYMGGNLLIESGNMSNIMDSLSKELQLTLNAGGILKGNFIGYIPKGYYRKDY